MYIKYIVNYSSVCLYHDIHSKTKVIYFEQGLAAPGGFCRMGFCLYPVKWEWGSSKMAIILFFRSPYLPNLQYYSIR